MTPDHWAGDWLPAQPYATNDPRGGIHRAERDTALTMRYLQTNGMRLANTLVTDIDHRDAELRAMTCPARPNIITTNHTNGHAHALWIIKEPVTTTEYGSYKAISYMVAITEGLRRATDGDIGYTGLITKNPIHEHWQTTWYEPDLWELPHIAEALGAHMPPRGWRRRPEEVVGLGRNCALFDQARKWAYREARNHWGDPTGLATAIAAHVAEANMIFTEPLPPSEVRAISRSIHKWITTKSRIWRDGEAGFKAVQARRAIKGGQSQMWQKANETRTAKRLALIEDIGTQVVTTEFRGHTHPTQTPNI